MLYLRPAVCEPQLLPKRQHQRVVGHAQYALQHIPRNTFPLKPELGECVEAELQVEVPLDDLPLIVVGHEELEEAQHVVVGEAVLPCIHTQIEDGGRVGGGGGA